VIDVQMRMCKTFNKDLKVETESASLTWIGRPFIKIELYRRKPFLQLFAKKF
jgi:hypothetical protein